MEKRRFSLMIPLLLCSCLPLLAQWDDPPGQYWAVKGYYNPSFAGETEAIRTTALYRYQWTGIENAPRQLFLTADMPFEFLGLRHGTGLVVYTETVGEIHNSFMAVQYSFKKQTQKGTLQIGLQAGVYDLQFDAGNKLIINDSLQTNRGTLVVNPADKKVVDLGAGISWTGKSFFAGLSTMHVNQPRFYAQNDSLTADLQSDSAMTSIPRSYNLMFGCNITLIHPLKIQPMLWVQTDFGKTNLQTTLRMDYNKKYSGGATWRMDDGYVLFAGAIIREIEIGYAYCSHTSGMGRTSKGSHEIYLRYDFPLDFFKPKQQPHKSIRLL